MKKICLLLSVLFLMMRCAIAAEHLTGKSDAQGRDAIVVNAELLIDGTEPASVSTNSLQSVRIYTVAGRDAFSDTPFLYNKRCDELLLIKGGTYLSDNTFIPIEDKGINEVTPDPLANSLMYGDFTNRVYSFPQADPGNTVFIEIRKKEPFSSYAGFLNGTISLTSFYESLKTSLSILVPSGVDLKYDSPVKPSVSEKRGKKIYTFVYGHSERIKTEANMPPSSDIVKSVVFSTAPDWKSALASLKKDIELSSVVTPEILAQSEKFNGKNLTEEQKVCAAAAFVKYKIKDVYLPLGVGGYKPRTALDVLKSGYGDRKDKTVLFISFMKALNIEASAGLYKDDFSNVNQKVPAIRQFTSIIPFVKKKDSSWGAVDISEAEVMTGYFNTRTGAVALILNNALFVPLKSYLMVPNKVTSSIKGALNEDGSFSGRIFISAQGLYDTIGRASLKGLGKTKLKIYYEKMAELFYAASELKGFSNSDPENYDENLEVSMGVLTRNFALVQGNIMIFRLPSPTFSFSSTNYNVASAERRYPYLLGSEKEISYTSEIELPEGYKPIYLPSDIKISNPVFKCFSLLKYSPENNSITCKRKVEVLNSVLPLKHYPLFKETIESIGLDENNTIILEKIK